MQALQDQILFYDCYADCLSGLFVDLRFFCFWTSKSFFTGCQLVYVILQFLSDLYSQISLWQLYCSACCFYFYSDIWVCCFPLPLGFFFIYYVWPMGSSIWPHEKTFYSFFFSNIIGYPIPFQTACSSHSLTNQPTLGSSSYLANQTILNILWQSMILGNDSYTVQFAGEYLIAPLAKSKFNQLNKEVEEVNCLQIFVKSTGLSSSSSYFIKALNYLEEDLSVNCQKTCVRYQFMDALQNKRISLNRLFYKLQFQS